MSKPSILVAEDEGALITLLRYNLEREGYRVLEAQDGEEALLVAAEEKPDLVLLDWMLTQLTGIEVHLGPTEYKLLDHLIQHPGRVFSREQLLDAVWGSDVYVEARTVDVHVGRLRKALNIEGVSDPIRTVRSAGYSLDENTAVKAAS